MENAIKNLIDFAGPDDARQILWDWYRCTVVGNYTSLDKRSKDGIACLYELIDQLLAEQNCGAAATLK